MAALYVAGLLIVATLSTPRRVGDGGEYFAMAMRLASLQPPAVTREELAGLRAEVGKLGPGFDSALLEYPNLVGRDGRQDFLHFFLYPLFVVPMWRVAALFGLHPNWAFTVTNVGLLGLAAFLVLRRVPAAVWLGAFLSPIVWWIDKAHTEAFLFATVAVAAATFDRNPTTALIAYALAGAQNVAVGMTYPVFAWLLWYSARREAGKRRSAFARHDVETCHTGSRRRRLGPLTSCLQLDSARSGVTNGGVRRSCTSDAGRARRVRLRAQHRFVAECPCFWFGRTRRVVAPVAHALARGGAWTNRVVVVAARDSADAPRHLVAKPQRESRGNTWGEPLGPDVAGAWPATRCRWMAVYRVERSENGFTPRDRGRDLECFESPPLASRRLLAAHSSGAVDVAVRLASPDASGGLRRTHSTPRARDRAVARW